LDKFFFYKIMNIAFIKSGPWCVFALHDIHQRIIFDIINKYCNKNYLLIGSSSSNKFYKHLLAPNINIVDSPFFGKMNILLKNLSIYRELKLFKPNIIISLGLFNQLSVLLYVLLNKYAKVCLVLIGEYNYHYNFISKYFHSLYMYLFRILLRRVAPHLLKVPCISTNLYNKVKSMCPSIEKHLVLYSYDLPDVFNINASPLLRVKIKHNGPLIMTNCRLNPRKGIHYLIMAIPKIIKHIRDVKVLIHFPAYGINNNSYYKYCVQLIEKFNLNEYIILDCQDLSYNMLPSYLTSADVFVLPSVDESLGLVVLEALKCGTPVVATKVGGIIDMVINGKNGFLVPPRDSSALAEAIVKVLTENSFKKRCKILANEGLRFYYKDRLNLHEIIDSIINFNNGLCPRVT